MDDIVVDKSNSNEWDIDIAKDDDNESDFHIQCLPLVNQIIQFFELRLSTMIHSYVLIASYDSLSCPWNKFSAPGCLVTSTHVCIVLWYCTAIVWFKYSSIHDTIVIPFYKVMQYHIFFDQMDFFQIFNKWFIVWIPPQSDIKIK